MFYKIIADIIVIIHFIWILFMIAGFILTIYGFFWKEFFNWWLFRTIHLSGIIFVSVLAILRKYCPVTILENISRARYDLNATYPGSFIAHYIQKLVYPDVNPKILLSSTVFIAIFTLIIFILKPPEKIRKFFSFPGNLM